MSYTMSASTLAQANAFGGFHIVPYWIAEVRSSTNYRPYYYGNAGYWGCASVWGITLELDLDVV